MVIATVSPSRNVNSGGGTIEVPVNTVVKSGTWLLLCNHSDISEHVRAISLVDVLPVKTGFPSRTIVHSTPRFWGLTIPSVETKHGPIEQL